MQNEEKKRIITAAKEHLSQVQEHIDQELTVLGETIAQANQDLSETSTDIQELLMMQSALIQLNRDRVEELEKMKPSPYFMRCDIAFSDEKEVKSYFFGKFSFLGESIFSWATPIASVRFEEPGPVRYETPEDGSREGKLLRKDQYMIVNSKIIFLASESTEYPRELIHQEYLSARKSTFALPEIVAQMEKAQDQVIRAHHSGPFLISGPAGSGKTTLALHRVAYLTQSPDTSSMYPSRSIIVFVQDSGTRDYFSHLLPELGIHNVRITTFSQWAFEVLKITDGQFVSRFGSSEEERDRYEYQKIQALRTVDPGNYRGRFSFSALRVIYDPYLSPTQKKTFQVQESQEIFDRYDLTLLLLLKKHREAGLFYIQDTSVRLKNGQIDTHGQSPWH